MKGLGVAAALLYGALFAEPACKYRASHFSELEAARHANQRIEAGL